MATLGVSGHHSLYIELMLVRSSMLRRAQYLPIIMALRLLFFAFAASLGASLLVYSNALAGSLRSLDNGPGEYEHARQTAIPNDFGAGEFTLELWIRPDNRAGYSVGPCGTGGNVRLNWCSEDHPRYAFNCWWCNGNFLLDGVDFSGNPQGGTFALQFYGGGRLRWLFGDGSLASTLDGYWSIGNRVGASNPSLLDGAWHHVAVVRRWVGATNTALELWIDGVLIDTETSARRPNLWALNWSGIEGASNQYAPWFWFAEKQGAVGALSQFEDYKGLLDEVRFWNRAKSAIELSSEWRNAVLGTETGLIGWFDFASTAGGRTCDRINPAQCMTVYDSNPGNPIYATENAPTVVVGGGVAPVITSANAAVFTIGTPGVFQATASGTPAPSLSLSGALPSGVGFTPSTGRLAGSALPGSAGVFPLALSASNASGTTTQNFTLTVNRKAQVITFNAPASGKSGLSLPLAANASSGLPVGFSVTSAPPTGVCTVSGTTLMMIASGTCNVRADQTGDGTYAPAPSITRAIAISANTPPVARDDVIQAIPGQTIEMQTR
jgi:hypothetical protein